MLALAAYSRKRWMSSFESLGANDRLISTVRLDASRSLISFSASVSDACACVRGFSTGWHQWSRGRWAVRFRRNLAPPLVERTRGVM